MGNKHGNATDIAQQPPEVDTKRLSSDRTQREERRQTLRQNRSSVRKSIAFSHSIFSQDGEDAKLISTTHFSDAEYRLMKLRFQSICLKYGDTFAPQENMYDMTLNICSQLFFPEDKLNEHTEDSPYMVLMKGAIFRAVIARKEEKELSWSEMLDVDRDTLHQEPVGEPVITFTEFIRALSVTCRGSFDEKARFAFRILDDNNNGVLTKTEAKNCLQALIDLNILTKLPPARVDDQERDEVAKTPDLNETRLRTAILEEIPVDKVELSYSVFKIVDEFFGRDNQVSFEEFRYRSWKRNNLFIDGLGVTEFFFQPLLDPVLEFLANDPFQYAGRLTNMKDEYYYRVDGGIMRCFTDESETKELTQQALTLSHMTEVRELHAREFGPNCFVVKGQKSEYKVFIAPTAEEKQAWMFCMMMYIITATNNRYDSYSPEREKTGAVWFVDAEDAYRAIAASLLKAHSQIFITDWCLSPFIYLIREQDHLRHYNKRKDDFRLDRILLKKARQGVKIHIIIWKETAVAGLNLSAAYTKRYLESLHHNIKVILHPPKFPIEWSHHQKIVIVDQRVAYLGGLDLCFGRFDNHNHTLVDNNYNHLMWPGADYYNPCRPYGDLMRISSVSSAFQDQADRDTTTRMPWHDVHVCIRGQIVYDISANFVYRWNHHLMQVGTSIGGSAPPPVARTSSEINMKEKVQRTSSLDIADSTQSESFSFSMMMAMEPSEVLKSLSESTDPDELSIRERSASIERSPSLYQRLTLLIRKPKDMLDFMPMVITSSDQKRSYIGKIKNGMKKKRDLRDVDAESLLEEQDQTPTEDEEHEDRHSLSLHEDQQFASTPVMSPSYFHSNEGEGKKKKKRSKSGVKLSKLHTRQDENFLPPPPAPLELSLCSGQMVRSIGSWSGGRKEQSLYHCMLDLIEKAQHYIYIENQYFISDTANDKYNTVHNTIGTALVNRIKRAMENNDVFRVIVVMPVHPEGNLMDAKTLYVMKWQYKTISRGQKSILEQLRAAFPDKDPSDYISFYNLRQWGIRNEIVHEHDYEDFDSCEFEHDDEEPVTEQIYVHSKLMIVDDLHVLIGSGNINDRSLMGDRDSEIGVVLTDTTFRSDGRMNGKKNDKCGLFASSLRKRLWREHLGLMESDELLEEEHCENHDELHEHHRTKVIDAVNDVADKFENLRRDLAHKKDNIKTHIKDMKEHRKKNPFESHTEFDDHYLSRRSSKVSDEKNIPIPELDQQNKEAHKSLIQPRYPSLNDPISTPTYKGLWMKTATQNTAIYEEVFEVIPRDNKYDTIDDYRRAMKKYRENWSRLRGKQRAQQLHEQKKKLKKIRGTLVTCPLNFLSKEKFPKSGKLTPLDDAIFV